MDIVRAVPVRRTSTLAALAAVTAAAIWASAASGVTPTPGCPSFAAQADAQERFFALGGSPARNAGGWDGDRDGVACEGLPGPYTGYATIGYHRAKRFLYGTATMPIEGDGEGFACLLGNEQFADGARRLTVYRALPGPDKAISRPLKAESRLAGGRLLWKLERELTVAGHYYVVFEAQIHLSPYQPSNCPEFGSRETLLPRPPRVTPSPRSGPRRRPPLRAPAPR